jgi:hypothetical protein
MMLLNSRQPPNHWFLYPGWNPGTLVFVLERLFGLYGDDQEVRRQLQPHASLYRFAGPSP